MKTNTEKLFMHTSTHTHTYSLTHTLMLSALYSYLVCVLKAGSAVFSEDHHCLSLIMADAPGVSLINRQSLLINNWTAPLVLMLSQCHTCSVSHSSHSHICMVIPCLVSCYTHWEIGNVTIESQKVCTHFKKPPKTTRCCAERARRLSSLCLDLPSETVLSSLLLRYCNTSLILAFLQTDAHESDPFLQIPTRKQKRAHFFTVCVNPHAWIHLGLSRMTFTVRKTSVLSYIMLVACSYLEQPVFRPLAQ